MKSWLLLPIVLLLSATTFAKPKIQKTTALLTQEQFSSLTYTEQLTYIKKVREIFVEMSERSPELAAEFERRGGLFAAVMEASMPMAIAQNGAPAAAPVTQNTSAFWKMKPAESTPEWHARNSAILARGYIQAFQKTKDPATLERFLDGGSILLKVNDRFVTDVPLSANAKAAVLEEMEILKGMQQANAEALKKIAPQSQTLADWEKTKVEMKNKEYTDIPMKVFNSISEGAPALNYVPPNVVAQPVRDGRVEVAVGGKTVVPSNDPKPPKVEKPAAESKPAVEAKPAEPKPAPPKQEVVADGTGARCMYAGFIVKGKDCMAPSEMPFELDGLPKPFACEDGKALCNPLIFGAEIDCKWSRAKNPQLFGETCMKNSKPYCVRRQSQATKECNRISAASNKFALEAAVFLNANTANRQYVLAFNESFEQLCDRENIDYTHARSRAGTLADVKATCENARTRFAEIKKKYSLVEETATALKHDQKMSEGKR